MQNGPPPCFGKEWEANAPECRGGIDPTYVHPRNGGNKRDQCQWYNACAQTTTNARAPQARGPVNSPPIPASNLLRPPLPQTMQNMSVLQAPPVQQQPAFMPPPAPTQQLAYAPPAVQPQAAPHVVYYGQTAYTSPGAAAVPVMVPMNTPMMGAQTQSFLMVQEPYENDGTGHGTRLARTLVRSMGKAAALTVANYLDYHPFGARPPGT